MSGEHPIDSVLEGRKTICMHRWLIITVLFFTFAIPRTSRAEPMRELIMSSAYGVLAGTLVGAATLAFTERPGDNLRNIARGASLGLYAGILLGLYVVYVVPSGDEEDEDYEPEARTLQPIVYPLISESNSIEGAAVQMKLLTF